jgi:NADH:ubiquinone oxidoreductase subunit 3 (subunit A)
MFLVGSILLVRFVLVFVLKLVSLLLSEKSLLIREELTSYECGFEHHSLSRVPFSLRYFFLTLIFLLFDLEIVLMMFLPSLIFSVNYLFALFVLSLFIVILFLSLVYE